MYKLISLIYWFRIVLGLLLAGAFLGFIIILIFGISLFILILSSIILLLFFLTGIVWAEKARKSKGTLSFCARIHNNPELDKDLDKIE